MADDRRAGMDVARPDRDPQMLALVFLGGTTGTAVRAALGTALHTGPGAWPWATLTVNLTGAFLLGILLETLLGRGPDVGARRAVRLAAGTGFLGGYTTYSAFAVDLLGLALRTALLYATATVLLGAAAAAAGIVLARRLHPRTGGRP